MEKSCKDKLMACRTYAEAKPILETAKGSLSAHELMHTAFAIQEKQPDLANSFKQTVIQELDAVKPKEGDPSDNGPLKEIDGGTSHQQSSTAGLEKIGTEHSSPEGASQQYDKKDQMGVAINETYGQFGMPQQQPPMGGGMPPMGGMPQQRPQMPPQQQQMMQYTINETIRLLAPNFNKMVEAIKALDKKIQETQKDQVRELAVGDKLGKQGTHTSGSFIRETVEGNTPVDLNLARNEIKRMNDSINSGIY